MFSKDHLKRHALGDALTVPERLIWDTAGDYIERYGEYAAIEASKRADASLAEGDLGGQRTWQRVTRSITRMTDSDGEIAN